MKIKSIIFFLSLAALSYGQAGATRGSTVASGSVSPGGGGGGSGTVTSVSVTTANGVSGSVATATTTPAISLTLGDITPSSVASTGAISGTAGTFSATTSLLLGTAGSAVGNIGFKNATSGTITLGPVTGALGTVALLLPAASDTLVGKATTDTLTNKTLTSPAISNPAISGTATLSGGAATIDASSGDGTISATGGGKWIHTATERFNGAIQDSAGSLGSANYNLISNGSGILTYAARPGSYTVLLSGGSVSAAASTTYYAGGVPAANIQTNEGRYKVYLPKAGTIKGWVFTGFAGGGGDGSHSFTVDVWLNNTTALGQQTVLSTAASYAAASGALSQAVTSNGVSGDYIEARIICPSGMTTMTTFVGQIIVYIETTL